MWELELWGVELFGNVIDVCIICQKCIWAGSSSDDGDINNICRVVFAIVLGWRIVRTFGGDYVS